MLALCYTPNLANYNLRCTYIKFSIIILPYTTHYRMLIKKRYTVHCRVGSTELLLNLSTKRPPQTSQQHYMVVAGRFPTSFQHSDVCTLLFK